MSNVEDIEDVKQRSVVQNGRFLRQMLEMARTVVLNQIVLRSIPRPTDHPAAHDSRAQKVQLAALHIPFFSRLLAWKQETADMCCASRPRLTACAQGWVGGVQDDLVNIEGDGSLWA